MEGGEVAPHRHIARAMRVVIPKLGLKNMRLKAIQKLTGLFRRFSLDLDRRNIFTPGCPHRAV